MVGGIQLEPAGADDASSAPSGVDDTTSTGSQPPAVPTELPEYTTETSQVLAMPDGTFELTAHRRPVRTEKDGHWVDIDKTLQPGAAGGFSPRATTAPIVLSGGGAGPLVTIGEGDQSVSIAWESTLPQPNVVGDTATYAGVRPGVDLVVMATEDGFTQSLVVHDKQAAAELAANPATLSAEGHGLDLRVTDGGSVSAVDGTTTAFRGSDAVMWDSSGGGTGEFAPAADDPGTGRVRPVDTSITQSAHDVASITLAPPAGVVADPATVYPLYLDPPMSDSRVNYRTVQSGGWNYTNDANELMRVGYCGWTFCTADNGNARSFFSFDVSALTSSVADAPDAYIFDATVKANQVYNATSADSPVNLTKADAFLGTSYPGPVGAFLQQISSNNGYNYQNAGNLSFSNTDVRDYVQAAANSDTDTLRFSLSAPAENNKNYWKKFANDPVIEVRYTFAPGTPYDLQVDNEVECTGKPRYLRDATPKVSARAKDFNPGAVQVGLSFEIWKHAGYADETRSRYNPATVNGSGEWAGTAVPSLLSWTTSASNSNNTAALPNDSYGLRVHAENIATDSRTSPWSPGWYKFTLDNVGPSGATTLKSFAYPQEYWGAASNATGTIIATSSTDATGFAYAIDSSSAVPSIGDTANNDVCNYAQPATLTKKYGYADATGGTANLTIPAGLSSGLHTIYVKAFDDAHNVQNTAVSYRFYVSPTITGVPAAQTKNLVEVESMTPSQPDGQTDSYMYTDSNSQFSGGSLGRIVTNRGTAESPVRFNYAFAAPIDAYYALGVNLMTTSHHAKLQFRIDNELVKVPSTGEPLVVDTYSAALGSKYVPLGEYLPYEGLRFDKNSTHTLSVEVVGTSGTSYTYNGTYGGVAINSFPDNGYSAGVDFLTLAPLQLAPFATLAAAFNNDGIGTDNTAAASLNVGNMLKESLSSQALAAAGLAPGATFTSNGVSFTMPQPTTDGDNVISSGQTIQLPANTTASSVNLLVAATCGAVAPGPARALSMRYEYADGSVATSDSLTTEVPDWFDTPHLSSNPAGATLDSMVTLDHSLQGTAVNSRTPTLYVMKFPVKDLYATDPIASVTLPRVGTDFTNTCNTPALHVLALSTS